MKTLLPLLLLLAGSIRASTITSSSVPLAGSGTFSFGWGDGTEVILQASGEGASFFIDTVWGAGSFNLSPGNTAHYGIGGATQSHGIATIGNITSSFFDVYLGQAGSLTLYDGINGSMLATTTIDALELIESRQDDYIGHLLQSSRGTLRITHNPEPGAWILMASGLALVIVARSLRRKLV